MFKDKSRVNAYKDIMNKTFEHFNTFILLAY